MKEQTFKSLGLVVKIQVPTSYEEFDSLAKVTGAALNEAIRNVVYRGTLAEFRDVLLHGRKENKENGITAIAGMDDIFKMERLSEVVKGDDGKPKMRGNEEVTKYTETEDEFFKRIVATNKISEQDQQALADVVSAALVFDPSATERKPSAPKKLAAKYIDNAKKLIAGGKIEELNKRLYKAIGKSFTATGDEAKDAESLGWLVKEFVDWNAEQTMTKLVS